MKCIVTSYKRLGYLKKSVESLRKVPGIQIIIIDGGSDEETKEYIKTSADSFLFLENIGADFQKNEGIKRFTSPGELFIITSDDFIYPENYTEKMEENYRKINSGSDKWDFCAASTAKVPEVVGDRWVNHNGIEVFEVGVSQVAGAIMSHDAWDRVGGFPVVGKCGHGDFVISTRLRALGYRLCYFKDPYIQHLGDNKLTDYPELTKIFNEDWEEFGVKAMEML